MDMIGIAPAYEGLVNNSYILAVSAPSLAKEHGSSLKADRIIDVIYDKLTPEQRSVIDRVRVYNSAEELKQHAKCNFDHSFYGYCEGSMEDLQAQTMSITI